jgi:hypothetical protein
MRKREHSLNDAHGASVLANEAAAEVSGLVKKREVARAASVSCRSVENWMRQKRIPFVRLSPRCVRFHLPSVLAALRKFEIKEIG